MPITPVADSTRRGGAPPSARAIHDAIRRDIILLRLKPGERLSENELALRFGTSRTPVREALIRLIDEGLIEVWPQRGTFVSRISLSAVRRARFVRQALEVAIVRQAAEQGIDAPARAVIEGALAEQEAARDDPARFMAADDAFHRAFADAIGLSDVWSIVESEKAQFDRIRLLSLPDVTPVATLIAQHRAVLAAVLAGDGAAAEQRMREHMSEVTKVADPLAATHPQLIVNDG